MKRFNLKIIAAAILGLAAVPTFAALTYSGCPDMLGSDFTITSLNSNATDTTIKEPGKMALMTNDQNNVDVYFIQRYGKVRKYDGTTKATSTVANFNFGSGTNQADTNQISTSSSEGLQGIALDPAFKTNHWVYLYFVMKTTWKVTRYTLTGTTLDLATAKTIIRFTHTSFAQHAGSTLRFDADGNLWMTVADNGGSNWPDDRTVLYQAANTNKYFGKILRIKPRAIPDNQSPLTPGLGSTYDVPAGNLRQKFFDIGGPTGQDTNKILPEVYVMGSRNPYSIAIDTVRKAVAWGDVGPDTYGSGSPENQWTEEFNFTTQPGNFGWPMWAGKLTPMPTAGWAGFTAPSGVSGTMSAPINTRPDNTGVTNLSPAQPAMINYVKNCAITGPVYYYKGSDTSKVKFPPHLNGAWFIADFNSPWINAVEMNAAGTAVLSMKKMFSVSTGGSPTLSVATTGNSLKQINPTSGSALMNTSNSITDLQMGSDGAMYVMNYSGYRTYDAKAGLLRITYNGTCQPAVVPLLNAHIRDARTLMEVRGLNVSILATGIHSVEVRSLSGKLMASRKGSGLARYTFDELKNPGIYLVYLNSDEGRRVQKIIRQ